MGLGHWIGKKLGISRDLTPIEIRNALEEIRKSIEQLEVAQQTALQAKTAYIKGSGKLLSNIFTNLYLLTDNTSSQDRTKLKALRDLIEYLAPSQYHAGSGFGVGSLGDRVVQSKQIPLIKKEIDKLLREYPA